MITKQKGTYDIYGDLAKKRAYVDDVLASICEKYNYGYIETPVFESSDLFHRGVGESTDMVKKETYDFKDRGDRNLTLRPEGTAGERSGMSSTNPSVFRRSPAVSATSMPP